MVKQISTSTPKKQRRILVVEDERPLAHALELKLSNCGYAITIASTGTEGAKEAQTKSYDLILLDLILPGIDGFGVLKELKDKNITIPVIVLSNLGQEEDQRRAKEFGVKEYYVKSNTPLKTIVDAAKKFLQ